MTIQRYILRLPAIVLLFVNVNVSQTIHSNIKKITVGGMQFIKSEQVTTIDLPFRSTNMFCVNTFLIYTARLVLESYITCIT